MSARRALLVVLAAFVCVGIVSGCAEEDTSSPAAQEPTAEGEQANPEAEAVSELCRAAMTAYHDALITLKNPNEEPLEVATLKACKSRGEWLAAVQPYADEGQGCPIACLEPETVYLAMCGGHEKLPACRE